MKNILKWLFGSRHQEKETCPEETIIVEDLTNDSSSYESYEFEGIWYHVTRSFERVLLSLDWQSACNLCFYAEDCYCAWGGVGECPHHQDNLTLKWFLEKGDISEAIAEFLYREKQQYLDLQDMEESDNEFINYLIEMECDW